MNIETEIKNIIASYDSNLIYILRRLKKLEEVARAGRMIIEDYGKVSDLVSGRIHLTELREALKELGEL